MGSLRSLWLPYVSRGLGALHRAAYRASGGRVGARIWGLPIVLLTTTGRRSGKRRTTPLCALPDGDDFAVIASFGGLDTPPSWWLNLEHDPHAIIQVGSASRRVTAHTTSGDERARLWAEVTARAPGYLGYARRTAREIPVVVLHLEA
ncbi:MAG: nitroreductase family deazaflavin-dependent oxidoreductase [Gaiellaceae bacterium]